MAQLRQKEQTDPHAEGGAFGPSLQGVGYQGKPSPKRDWLG
jgi:hypothetical protein